MPYLLNLELDQAPFELGDLTLLGSDSTCQVTLSGDHVCERHARIERREDGCYLRDLRSRYGTQVNGIPLQEGHLQHEDEIQIAGHRLLFLQQLPESRSLGLSSKNSAWSEQLRILAEVAPTINPVLILGPSGAGKEVLAQALHNNSRRDGPFISVNCSALTETLIESELFGHLKGSFTGAIADRKGAFEAARGGTLFLDEIGDLPYVLQAKLLRALENNEIRPVGSDRNIKTNVRIVAATHQNLIEKISLKEFRSDLYFRLNVVTARIPSLQERPEDFEDLLMVFAKKMRVRFSLAAIIKLKQHIWPGNIRELKNTVTRASAFFPRTLIEEHHVGHIIDPLTTLPGFDSGVANSSPLPSIKEVEKQMIIKRLIANMGNQRRTAHELGIPKSTLHDRLKTYHLNPKDYSAQSLRDSRVLERLSL